MAQDDGCRCGHPECERFDPSLNTCLLLEPRAPLGTSLPETARALEIVRQLETWDDTSILELIVRRLPIDDTFEATKLADELRVSLGVLTKESIDAVTPERIAISALKATLRAYPSEFYGAAQDFKEEVQRIADAAGPEVNLPDCGEKL